MFIYKLEVFTSIEDLASVKPGSRESSNNLQNMFGSKGGVGCVEDKARHLRTSDYASMRTI